MLENVSIKVPKCSIAEIIYMMVNFDYHIQL